MTYIYVKKITKVMILFEGYKKAVEIYNKYSGTDNGRKTVTWYNNELGVSKEYLVWFTSCIACYNIPLYIVLSAYKDWKRYVVSYYKKNGQPIPNIESLNYQQTMKIINECKRQWAKPNPIYNKNGVYVGEFKSFSDANMLPINTDWCITKTKIRYNEFNNENSKCFYVINNRNQDPWRRVIAVVYTDRVEYWDSTNIRIEDNIPYENTLPSEVVGIIHSKCQKLTESKQYNTNMNKNKIRLTESQLHRIIKESLKRILSETRFGKPQPVFGNAINGKSAYLINDTGRMVAVIDNLKFYGNSIIGENRATEEKVTFYLTGLFGHSVDGSTLPGTRKTKDGLYITHLQMDGGDEYYELLIDDYLLTPESAAEWDYYNPRNRRNIDDDDINRFY